jgi:hypothetical protein
MARMYGGRAMNMKFALLKISALSLISVAVGASYAAYREWCGDS